MSYGDNTGDALRPALSSLRDGAPDGSPPFGLQSAIADDECPKCQDSGWMEFTTGGFWTGENLRSRLEICDCICGDDVRREQAGERL